MYTQEHKARIMKELSSLGLSRYALSKNEVKYLPHIIHEGEQIGAVVVGRSEVGSVMLVATDKRVLYLDCKSFYTTTDELTYDVVAGVMYHVQGLFANVILHTRVGEYNLRLVNKKMAKKFVHFLESKRLEVPDTRTSTAEIRTKQLESKQKTIDIAKLDKKVRNFLYTHYIGVLSTASRTGEIHGATVYYTVMNDQIYFLTKSETNKAKNIIYSPRVALTIFEEFTMESMQIRGLASLELDTKIRQEIFDHITSPRSYQEGQSNPPVTKIAKGNFVVYCLKPSKAKYNNYK